MRFSRVTAHAHGPFVDETLVPVPGLTVVWGLNEAGKSSWHSAALLVVTGLGRRRGRPSKGDQETIDRRKPRSGDRWQLEAELHLDHGEDLTVTWDLNQRVAKVLDGLGRDRSNEWMTDGAPDLSRIVGLDRASFVATACVRQSDLQRVRDDADVLQALLQKATTSSGADATASAAIAIIDQFRRDQVGLERESSTRPLMEARRRVEAASHELRDAQTAHRNRLELLAELTRRRADLADCNDRHQALSTALAIVDARRCHSQLVGQRDAIRDAVARVQQLNAQIHQLRTRAQLLVAACHHAEGVEALEAVERQMVETATVRGAAEAAEQEHRRLHRQQLWLEHEQARRTAWASRQRLDRVIELQGRHRTPPPDPTDVEQLTQHARVVLDRWHERPALPVLTGPTTRQLTERLTVLAHAIDGVDRPAAASSVDVAVVASPRAPHRGAADSDEQLGSDSSGHTSVPDAVEGSGVTPGRSGVLPPGPQAPADGSAPTDSSGGAPAVWAGGALVIGVVGLTAGALVHPALFALAVVGVAVGVIGAVVVWRDRSRSNGHASPELQQRLVEAEAAEMSTRRAALSAQLERRRIDEARVVAVRRALDRLGHGMAAVTTAIQADPTLPLEEQADGIQRWLTEHAEQRRLVQIAHEEWFELTTLLGDCTVADLAQDVARDQAHWQVQHTAVHDLEPTTEALASMTSAALKDRLHRCAAATSDAARRASELRLRVPAQDLRLESTSARRAVDAALQHLHDLGGATDAERLAGCSVDEICAALSTCRQEHEERKQARDEAAGQLHQLRATATSARPTSAHRRSTAARSTIEPSTIEPSMVEAVRPAEHDTDTEGAPGITFRQITPTVPIASPATSKATAGTGAENGSEALESTEQAAGLIRQLEAELHALPGTAAIGFAPDRLPPAEGLRTRLEAVAIDEAQLRQSIAGLEGRLQERRAPGGRHDPAAAAERHAAAVEDLARVRDLAEVLDETRSLLTAAEDRVHRDIAPLLNDAVNRWLPRIFGDRYTKVLIDPARLDVQVFASETAGPVDLLSHGTTELFYLLLRLALSETLTAGSNETCPLLLDDITVDFDLPRKIAALELLREVASERQVLMFTQEEEVRTWARANLTGKHALIELPGRVEA